MPPAGKSPGAPPQGEAEDGGSLPAAELPVFKHLIAAGYCSAPKVTAAFGHNFLMVNDKPSVVRRAAVTDVRQGWLKSRRPPRSGLPLAAIARTKTAE